MKEEIKRNKAQAKINKFKWKKEIEDKIDDINNNILFTIKDWKSKDFNDDEVNEIRHNTIQFIIYNDLIDESCNKDMINITRDIKYLTIIKDFTITDFKVWFYIISKLKAYSNKFECNYDDLANYLNISTGGAYVAMNNFVNSYNNVLIQKTNISKLFIINHNIVIKGNSNMFNNLYVSLYGNDVAAIDDKGRAIIK